jgi:hypothetical protein
VILHAADRRHQRYVDPLAGINDLQEMSKTHEAISKAKTQTWHRILTTICRCIFRRLSASPATAAPTGSCSSSGSRPRQHDHARPGGFTREAWSLVGRKVSKHG